MLHLRGSSRCSQGLVPRTGRRLTDARANMVDCKILIPASLCLLFAHGAPIGIQAQEHGNVTLTWGIPLEADAPRASLYIDILSVQLEEHCIVYRYSNLYQPEPYQDQLYRGRVRCNLELAQQGRIECVFSNLRLNDSGNYTCIAGFDGENLNRGTQYLRVKAQDDDKTKVDLDPQSLPNPDEEAETGGRLYLGTLISGLMCVLLVLGGAAAACALKRLRDNRLRCDAASTKPLKV